MSTSFGGWTIHMQAAFLADPMGYDAPIAIYGKADVVYGPVISEAQWVTLDCQVTRVSCAHGGKVDEVPGIRASVGTMTASLHDPNRELDPTSSPYALLTGPGVPVRLIVVSPSGTTVPLWTGTADSWTHDYLTGDGELSASDMITKFTGVTLTNWKRPNETSQARYLAAVAMIPGGFPFTYEGAAMNLSAATISGSAWEGAVVKTAEAEQSIVWVDQQGRLRRRDTSGMPPALKARDCDDGICDLVYTALGSSWDDEDLTNTVIMERLNIADKDKEREPLRVADTASVNEFGVYSITHTDLPLLDDAALDAWGRRVLDLRANPTAEATGMQVTLQDNYPWTARTVGAAAALSVGDILDINLTSKGDPERWLAAIAGISHDISTTAWTVGLELVDGPRFAANAGYDDPSSIYGVTVYGRAFATIPPMEVSA